MMCSYNAINGVPSCANKWLLQDTLRGKWGFTGYVSGDSGAVNDISSSHFYAPNASAGAVSLENATSISNINIQTKGNSQHHFAYEPVVVILPPRVEQSAAISAGCDVQSAGWKAGQPWNTSGAYITDLPVEVKAGRLNESVIDAALRNALGLRFRLGLFDPIDDRKTFRAKRER